MIEGYFICIMNYDVELNRKLPLTIGKQYSVLECETFGNYNYYLVVNDMGHSAYYSIMSFISAKEYRNKVINEVLDLN